VQGEVAQSGGAGGADAILGACPAAVAKFEVYELAAGGVRGEDGEAVACAASSPLLRAVSTSSTAGLGDHPAGVTRYPHTRVGPATTLHLKGASCSATYWTLDKPCRPR